MSKKTTPPECSKKTFAARNPFAGAAIGSKHGSTIAVAIILCGWYLLAFGEGYHSNNDFWEWLFLGTACFAMIILTLLSSHSFRQGKCPYCDTIIGAIPFRGKIKCKSCKNRILVKREQFWTMDN